MAAPARAISPPHLDSIHPDALARTPQLAEEFAAARPFPNVVIEPFLDPAACQALLDEFPPFTRERARNEHGEVGGKATLPNLSGIGPAYARLDRLLRSADFLSWISQITGIPDLLFDPEYIGGGTHENLNGQELDNHVDFNYHTSTGWYRRLNLLLYLNPQWEHSWGGCLDLLPDPFATEGLVTVAPIFNRCVIFETSEHSWHGFERIQLPPGVGASRRSIAVYFYTKDPPPAGGAPSHGTFYYQRPLPERMRAGYTLTEQDANELESLVARRDHYIRFLYDREKDFSQTIELCQTMKHVVKSRLLRMGIFGKAILAPSRAVKTLFK